MEIRVRKIEPGDLFYIAEIEEKVFGLDAFPFYYLFQLYEACRDFFLVADYKGLTIGYIVSCLEDKRLHIHSIAVIEGFRGKGIGKKLLEETVKLANNVGVKEIYLEVKTQNIPAITLYEKMGFKRVGTREGYYADGSDAFVYVLRLC
ncbi:MAG: ribosomal protein S18-alanine N-acetyltransferase [Thermofilum sp.]|nr:ribosomal protein S18-alanine N-acetyltransferase [Thermofilum sp.]